MQIYFTSGAQVVASKEVDCTQPQEAIAVAQSMFDEGAFIYDSVEVWSLTRRVYKQARRRRPAEARRGTAPPTAN